MGNVKTILKNAAFVLAVIAAARVAGNVLPLPAPVKNLLP